MRLRYGCSIGVLLVLVFSFPKPVAGQSPARTPAATAAVDNWKLPRTPDGQPDIQGTWTNYDNTPFEAPGAEDVTALAALAKWFPGINTSPAPGVVVVDPNATREVVGFGDGPGKARRNAARRSMVVDPPNGRVPVRPEARAKKDAALNNLTDSWENHTPWERCITRGVPGGIFPPSYGAGYQIVQSPGYVTILYEMIHEARIIPLDGRPHLPSRIRLWNGDSRGRWDGNTLVVDTTNYNDKGSIATNIATAGIRGITQSEDLHVVERFTLVDANTIQYEVTIDDPKVYMSPWKVALPLNRDESYQIFEYACHEGNYGLINSLSAGRAEEKK
jgi:hypothetical protein